MDELKRYIIEGQVQDELITEMNESTTIPVISEENEYMKHKASKLVESVLREFEVAIGSNGPDNDPYKNVDPRVRKSQTLVRLLQDNLWKMQDMKRTTYPASEELDDDIKALMTSTIEPLVKACVNKLHSIWFGEAPTSQDTSQDDESEDEPQVAQITIGQDITTPQSESLKVKKIMGDKIMLEDVAGNTKLVEKTILDKWMKRG